MSGATALRASVQAVAVAGPGLRSWAEAAPILAGSAPWIEARTEIPTPALLAPAERRRAGRVLRLAVAVAHAAAGGEAARLPSVFTSSGGETDNCHELCQALATPERAVSPTRFMNSVHNAPAGYWSLAAHSMQPSTSLCAHDGSFVAGLLEAVTTLRRRPGPLLLVAFDGDYPEPLRSARPITDAFAVALRLAPADADGALARIVVSLGSAAATVLPDGGLERLRASIPAARSLPLLSLLAGGRGTGGCVLDYLDDLRLAVQVEPC